MLKIFTEEINKIIPQKLGMKVLLFIVKQPWALIYDLAIECSAKQPLQKGLDINKASRYVLVRRQLAYCTDLWSLLEKEFPQEYNSRKFGELVAFIIEKLPQRKELQVGTENCRMAHTHKTIKKGLSSEEFTIESLMRADDLSFFIFRRKRKE